LTDLDLLRTSRRREDRAGHRGGPRHRAQLARSGASRGERSGGERKGERLVRAGWSFAGWPGRRLRASGGRAPRAGGRAARGRARRPRRRAPDPRRERARRHNRGDEQHEPSLQAFLHRLAGMMDVLALKHRTLENRREQRCPVPVGDSGEPLRIPALHARPRLPAERPGEGRAGARRHPAERGARAERASTRSRDRFPTEVVSKS